MSFAALRPGPGRHCFHADFAQEHNTLIHVVVFLVSACLTVLWFFHASAHRNHGESWTRLVLRSCFCCIFFHIVFSARTCAARLLSRLVGWIVDLTNCTVLLVSLLSSLLSSSSPFLLLLFYYYKFFVSIDNRSNL